MAVAASLMGAVTIASARTTTTSLSVQTAVATGCNVSATALGFGTYTPGAGAIPATTTIKFNCTNKTVFAVGLSVGTTSGATYAQRLMASGANTLQYNLYTTSGHGTVWGDGSGSTAVQSGVGNGTLSPTYFTVYGLLPDSTTNQTTAAGTYSDTIEVVVSY